MNTNDLYPHSPAKLFPLAATAISLLSPLAAFAGTTTIFAPGVTETSGWYDVNKKSTENNAVKDFSFCWAAAASNLIDYWEAAYVGSGKKLPASVPAGSVSVGGYESPTFDIFLDADNWDPYVRDDSGIIIDVNSADPYVALKWYFNGEGHNASGYAVPLKNTGGYWKDEYSTLQSDLGGDFISDIGSAYSIWGGYAPDQSREPLEIFSEIACNILSKGAGALGINASRLGGHAITLWGADVDEQGLITALYITDSDDTQKHSEGKIWRYGVAQDPLTREVYLTDTIYGDKNLIIGLYGLTAYPIPEPSEFALLAGTLAATMACSRRKTSRRLP